MERKEKIVCKSQKEYDQYVSDFIMSLEPKVGMGMYNVSLYIDKIKEYKKCLIVNDNN